MKSIVEIDLRGIDAGGARTGKGRRAGRRPEGETNDTPAAHANLPIPDPAHSCNNLQAKRFAARSLDAGQALSP